MTMTESDVIHFRLAIPLSVTSGLTWVTSSAPGHSWVCFNLSVLVFISAQWLQFPELL